MNYLIIIQFLGFYVISSFGIYYFLLTYDKDNMTLLDSIIILISFLYYPLIIIYDVVRILKFKYKQLKYKRQFRNEIAKEIKELEKLLDEENNK